MMRLREFIAGLDGAQKRRQSSTGSTQFSDLAAPRFPSIFTAQGYAAGSSGPTIRNHCRYARYVGAASSIRVDMIFGRDKDRALRSLSAILGALHAFDFRLV